MFTVAWLRPVASMPNNHLATSNSERTFRPWTIIKAYQSMIPFPEVGHAWQHGRGWSRRQCAAVGWTERFASMRRGRLGFKCESQGSQIPGEVNEAQLWYWKFLKAVSLAESISGDVRSLPSASKCQHCESKGCRTRMICIVPLL